MATLEESRRRSEEISGQGELLALGSTGLEAG
jgi:hypothetical protein